MNKVVIEKTKKTVAPVKAPVKKQTAPKAAPAKSPAPQAAEKSVAKPSLISRTFTLRNYYIALDSAVALAWVGIATAFLTR